MRDEFPVVNRAPGKRLAPRPVQEIACGRCPATDALSAAPSRQPAHTVALKFSQRGWRVVGVGKHVCPACVAAEARRKASPKDATPKEPAPLEEAAVPPKDVSPKAPANENAAASPAASRSIVDLYVLLEDKYDRARKAYAPGYDDARVAEETGLALAVVQERRERDFGPLVVDTTREDLEATLGVLAGEIAEFTTLLRAAEQVLSGAQARLRSLTFAAGEIRKLAARLTVAPGEKAA